MKSTPLFLFITALVVGSLWVYSAYFTKPRPPHRRPAGVTSPNNRRVEKTAIEWKRALTRSQYNITRESGTEWPGSSELTHEHQPGVYTCICCHNPLFRSDTKFDSGTGWP